MVLASASCGASPPAASIPIYGTLWALLLPTALDTPLRPCASPRARLLPDRDRISYECTACMAQLWADAVVASGRTGVARLAFRWLLIFSGSCASSRPRSWLDAPGTECLSVVMLKM